MKTVISFDVGMKNLAYCLFQISDDITNTTDYTILKWEVINLCTPTVKKCNNGGQHECPEIAKYCKVLNKKSIQYNDDSYDSDMEHQDVDNIILDNNNNNNNNDDSDTYFEEDNIVYYCSKHAKKSNLKIPPSDLDIKKIKKKKLVDITAIIGKYDIALTQPHEGVNVEKRQKNTKEKMIEAIEKELDEKYLENIENVRANEVDLVTLGKNMTTELNKFIVSHNIVPDIKTGDAGDVGDLCKMGGLEKYKIDIVIIENQISTIASRMKTLQGMIAQYFIMKETPQIEFISAANKLKMFMTKKKTTYTERKLESVEVTKELLEKMPQFEKYKGCLEKNKKKDDLADCFLQGIYYLTLKKMITIEI